MKDLLYNVYMKAIQLTMDEELLEELDSSEEVQQEGRSAVVRRATAEYLARRRRLSIADRYRKGYGSGTATDDELGDWAGEGSWPED